MTLRIGSLCSGVGMLDLAVMDVLDAEVAWHAQYEPPDKNGREDTNQWAAHILAHRFPGVPNHGDLTAIDWNAVEPVDMITAGFPCSPVSNAGLRKGNLDERWIWPHIARAIGVLRPRIVLLENVSALVVRGLDAVLGGLASLRFDAEWTTARASDAEAPHQRERIFILAWPEGCVPSVALGVGSSAEGDGRDQRRAEPARILRRPDAALGRGPTAAHAASLPEREPADHAHPIPGSRNPWPEPGDRSLSDREREREDGGVIRLLPTPRTTDSNGAGTHGDGGMDLRTAIRTLIDRMSTGANTPPQSDAGRP